MPTPTTYPSAKQFVNFARETTQGTAVTTGMTTMPLTSFEPVDDPTWLTDEGMRGSMGKVYGKIQGPQKSGYSGAGAVFLDWLPAHLLNILGDLTTTGPVTSIYTHALALLNTATAQPPSMTQVDWQGLTATTQARVYAGSCHSQLVIKGNAESSLIEWTYKGAAYWSAPFPTAPPASAPSTVGPIAAWRAELGFGGTVAGAKVLTVRDYEITIDREISVQHTAQNTQAPYIIQRGPLGVTAKFFVAKPSDETFLNYMRNNTQPQFQFIASNGLGGAAAQSLTIDMAVFAVDMAKINRSDPAVGYDISGEAIHNTTNVGASGGYGPAKFTVTNAVAAF